MATNSQSSVHFHFLKGSNSLANRTALKSFITLLFKREKKKLEVINYIFCSDDYLLGINRQHLQHDFYTDIITFGLSEPGQPISAEVYISIDRVRDNAQQFKVPLKEELHRVIFHGALHLCGYKDKTAKDQGLMRKMEDKYLGLYFKLKGNVPRGNISFTLSDPCDASSHSSPPSTNYPDPSIS